MRCFVSCSACAGWRVGDRRGTRLTLRMRGACGRACCLVGALMLRALVGRVVRLQAVLVACAVSCARVWRWYGRGV